MFCLLRSVHSQREVLDGGQSLTVLLCRIGTTWTVDRIWTCADFNCTYMGEVGEDPILS